MTKVKEYFSHEYNARNDAKLESVFAEYGLLGIGLYWVIVESLYCEGGILPLKYMKTLAKKWGTTEEIVTGLINLSLDEKETLFSKNETHFWSESALRRLKMRQDIKQIKSESGTLGANIRWNNDKSQKTSEAPKKSTKDKQKIEYVKIPDIEKANITQKKYDEQIKKHGAEKFLKAVSVLDAWLVQGSKKAREYYGRCHDGHFRSDSWVWTRTIELLAKEQVNNGNAISSDYGRY